MSSVSRQPEETPPGASEQKQTTPFPFITFLSQHGGQMGTLMSSIDWSTTPVGPIAAWSPSLRTAISICLSSGFPMLVLWGPELVQFYNDAFCPILGAKHPQSLGQQARDCWTEIWEVIAPMFTQILTGGEAIWSEDQPFFLDRHGYAEETFFTFSYSPIYDETGKVGGILCTVKETTRQVVSERRLRMLRDLAARTSDVHTLEEACQSALMALAQNRADVPFVLLYLLDNERQQARLMGTTGTASPLSDRQAQIDLDERPSNDTVRLFVQVARTRQHAIIKSPACLDFAPEVPKPRQTCLVPIARAGDDSLAGLLVAGISPHHTFDEEYLGFFELVATHLATALSNARTHEEERKRVEALAQLDRAKTAFFSNISHEFRTPLTLTLGPLETLLADQEHPLEEEQRVQIELVRRNALRQLKLVNTLLDFARIEAGRVEAVYVPTDLAEFTTDIASAFRSAIEQAGLRFLVECPELAEPIWVDRQMWEKIVLNLLSNAFKFTFEGFIRVSLAPYAEGIELVVQDSGVGIREDDLPQLFKRFYRAQAPRARTQEGSGIGLALVRELVRLHDGSITVQSQEGAGTTFVVRLPRKPGHVWAAQQDGKAPVASPALLADPYVEEALLWQPEPRQEALALADSPDPALISDTPFLALQTDSAASDQRTNRLFVVDDNADMRAYLKRLLRPFYQVELVADGTMALALAREQRPDLIISDVMLPGLDGFALLKALHADPLTARIPVMLLSARAGEEATLEGLAAGAEDYVVKPFSARELLARVAARLDIAHFRREAELARERLYELLMQAPALICVLRGPEYVFELANPRYLQLVGHRNILGKPIYEALPELVGQGFYELLDQVYTTGEAFVGSEVRVSLDRDNTGRLEEGYFNFIYQPLRSATGEVEGIMVHAVEVTEEVQAHQQLQESEQRFRLMADQAPILIWMADEQGKGIYLNQRWVQFTGTPEEESYGLGWISHLYPADRERMLSTWREALSKQAPYETRFRLRRHDGVYRLMQCYGVPRYQDQAVFVGYIGTLIDITEEERARIQLAASEARFRFLAESMPQKIFTARPNGEVDYFNPQWSEFTGLPLEEMRDWGWIRFIHPEDVEENLHRWNHALETGKPFYGEQRFRRADGNYRWHVSRSVPIRDDEGAIIMWIGANTEIEEQKKLEERKDEFLNMVSHDLRSPLTSMKGNLQLAQRQLTRLLSTSDLSREATQQVLEGLSSLIVRALRQTDIQNRLIGDLLDVSRIQAGKLDLDQTPCDLVGLVREIVLDHQASAPGRSIILSLPETEELLLVLADPDRIGQVISNYLTNALKYSIAPAPITVGVQRIENNARVWVRDQGPGLSAEQQQRVWERFYQAPGITVQSGTGQGIGLGLHICQMLIKRHNGEVGVESTPGQGSTFWFTLPLLT